MATVTQRIKEIKKIDNARQPLGGYIHPKKDMTVETFSDGIQLRSETLHATTFGTGVDALFRATLPGVKPQVAFDASLRGAYYGFQQEARKLFTDLRYLEDSTNLTDAAIIAGLKFTAYDCIYRAGAEFVSDPAANINPNQDDIYNTRVMIERTAKFFESCGSVSQAGFTFVGDSYPHSGFTEIVTAGDGDILTPEGLWDLKVSVKSPTSDHTLQILMYWLMGINSKNSDGSPLYEGNFHNIKRIGVFNPRLNASYSIEVQDISDEIIQKVSKNVIGY